MKTATLTSLIELRDFLNALMTLPPNEASDLIANNGDDVIERANIVLGLDAYEVGDQVELENGVGQVRSKRMNGLNPLFSVLDQDGRELEYHIEDLMPCYLRA